MTPEGERPRFPELLDWLDGRLAGEEAARIAAWVESGDPHTRRTVDWLRGFMATARALPLHAPPPLVRQSLNQYFRRWRDDQAAEPRPARLLPARLMFDSRREVALAGTRAAGAAGTVHLAFTTEVADLVIDAHPLGGGRLRLDGQVLPLEPVDAPVFEAEAQGDGFSARTVDGDEVGRFSLTDVPAGVCRLRAGNGEITIVAELDLSGPGP